MPETARGLYFEDFEIGQRLTTPARTVTATDIVNFAGVSGDFNETHTNHEYCKTTPFGEPIAHGPLIYGIAEGLQYASGINQGTLLALLAVDNWRLVAPVKPGDTIRMAQTVVSKRRTSKPDRGIVVLAREILKQDGTVVQRLETTLLYRCRGAG